MKRMLMAMGGVVIAMLASPVTANGLTQRECMNLSHAASVLVLAALSENGGDADNLVRAKENLDQLRSKLPADMQKSLDKMIMLQEELAENPRPLSDPSHPVTSGKFDQPSLELSAGIEELCSNV